MIETYNPEHNSLKKFKGTKIEANLLCDNDFKKILSNLKIEETDFDTVSKFNYFDNIEISSNKIVMSCGSSVSAASLALAYSLINDDYIPKIYIGSWTEFGKK